MLQNIFSANYRLVMGIMISACAAVLLPMGVGASSGEATTHGIGITLVYLSVILLVGKAFSLVERWGIPSVLGEIVGGLLLGSVTLFGVAFFSGMGEDPILRFIAELGVVILLFQIGLESNITTMRSVGVRALLVAVVGVIVPFVLGTFVFGPIIFPELGSSAHLFIGAALTATSVGITARVFRDLGALRSPEAQIVLGAAVIDDVLGLIILAVVTAVVTVGAVSVGVVSLIVAKAVAFLVGAIVIGKYAAEPIGKMFARVNTGVGMKLTFALAFCFIFAAIAEAIGLAAIVGAFAAGLVLDAVHFSVFRSPAFVDSIDALAQSLPKDVADKVRSAVAIQREKHIEDLIEPLGHFTVPVFFVMIGFRVDIAAMANQHTLFLALILTLIAVVGKLIAGTVAGSGVSRVIIGAGMIPRGEVGLIFAAIGQSLGVVDASSYSVLVIMVMLTTLCTPPLLSHLIKRQQRAEHVIAPQISQSAVTL